MGNGGNITLGTPFLVALENSDIVADAFEGDGGSVDISARSLLGTAFRDEKTPKSDITASSEFGVSGTVSIDNLDVDPSSGVVALPENVMDSSNQISAVCNETRNNQFVASGRGGFPSNPVSQVSASRIWNDIRDNSTFVGLPSVSLPRSRAPLTQRSQRLVGSPLSALAPSVAEATAWRQTAQGEIVLTAATISTAHASSLAQDC